MKVRGKYVIAAITFCWALATGSAVASESAVHQAQSLIQAKVSLTDAIRIAERDGNGHAISASYELRSGNPPYYEVKVLGQHGGKLTRYDLNPNTGKVNASSDERLEKVFTRLKPTSIENAPTSLSRAIETAEERAGGKATDATIDRDGSQVKYSVEIARLDGTTDKVKINGSDGKVASAD